MKKNKTLKTLSILLLTLCAIPAWGQRTPSSTEDCTHMGVNSQSISVIDLIQRAASSDTQFYGRYPYLDTELLLEFKEELLEHISPETFYLWLANAPISEHKGKALTWILENGFDINYSEFEPPYMVELNALEYSLYFLLANEWLPQQHAKHEQMLELLLENDAACRNPEHTLWEHHGLESYIDHPEKIIEKKYKYLKEEVPPADAPKVPPTLHHIWLTHPDSPREISSANIEQILKNKKCFSESDYAWEHILWVNDKSLIPETAQALQAAGVSIREIAPHAESIGNYAFIQDCIDNKQWGMASDALRYSLVAHFGGVYSDVNYQFSRNLTHEILRYDFFGEDLHNGIDVHCCAFGAKPKHPIMVQAVENIAQNVGPNKPDYLRRIEDITSLTVATTSMEISNAYFEKAHVDGNIDVVYALRSPYPYTAPENETDWKIYYAENYPSLPGRCLDAFKLEKAKDAFLVMRKGYSLDPAQGYGKDRIEGSWAE